MVDHADLIAEARSWPDGSEKTMGEMFDALADALELVQRREAFARLREVDEALEATFREDRND
jgi:hypothetical protein